MYQDGKYLYPARPIQSDHLSITDYDDTTFGMGTLTWEDPVDSWKVGPGEVMALDNILQSQTGDQN